MGLPAGWVTDVPISRNNHLKALGNGVVPQQAVLALRMLGVGPVSVVGAA
jgi:DNA (cytosine-5)-methyltransferase 1